MSEHAFSVAEAAIRNGATHEVPMSAADAVFRAMFGFYGNLWLSKFAIGQLDDDGSDAGVTSAKSIWAHGLREFDVGTVKVALRQCLEHHPEFPPTLPQFVALCKAAMPRKTWAEENNLPQLPAPKPAAPARVQFREHNDGKDWARRLQARHSAGDSLSPYQVTCSRQALGLEGRMSWH